MNDPAPFVARAGKGPRILLVHGSATDLMTWSIQLASPLRERFTLIAYDRRREAASIEAHAADAAALIREAPGDVIVVGSSVGAVIALELARAWPTLVAGAVLIEPPMAASDQGTAVPAPFLEDFDRVVATQGGPAAGELFLRTVLGDAAFEQIPQAFRDRSVARWAEIRADTVALIAYRPRYDQLATVTTPTLLLGGGRSAPSFRATLDALAAVLPAARLEILPTAGHMLHVDASRSFQALLVGFADQLGR